MKIHKLTEEQIAYNIKYIIETSETKEELKGRLNAFIDNFVNKEKE